MTVSRARASTVLYNVITNTTTTPSKPKLNYGPGYVVLRGTITRDEVDPGMAWKAVGYFLNFDRPLTLTYEIADPEMRKKTSTTTKVKIWSTEGMDEEDLSNEYDPYWQKFVGSYVKVGGTLYNTFNPHTLADCMFLDPKIIT